MKTYDILITCSGEASPTVKVLLNEVDNAEWSRVSAGSYRGVSAPGTFPTYKTATNFPIPTRIVDGGDNVRIIMLQADGGELLLSCWDDTMTPVDLECNNLRLTANVYSSFTQAQ
jgi:hypothetical protein